MDVDNDNTLRGLCELIMETCNIAEPMPRHIAPDAPVIGPDSPFRLDSLDAVEIVVAIQKHYGVRIDSADYARKVLESFSTLLELVTRDGCRPSGPTPP